MAYIVLFQITPRFIFEVEYDYDGLATEAQQQLILLGSPKGGDKPSPVVVTTLITTCNCADSYLKVQHHHVSAIDSELHPQLAAPYQLRLRFMRVIYENSRRSDIPESFYADSLELWGEQ